MEELLKALVDIQTRLSVPKINYNKFGNFKFRSLEDIETAIKPLLKEHQCGIRFADEIVEHCGRTFLKTTLTFFNTKGESVSTTAEAEQAAQKTGMDLAQVTGAASSYARKYAMNAMFAIDDTRDSDTNEYQAQQQNQAVAKRPTSHRSTTKKVSVTVQTNSQNPRYAAIQNAIQSAPDVDSLLILYNQHRNEVRSNPEILNLFTQRKNQLQPIVSV